METRGKLKKWFSILLNFQVLYGSASGFHAVDLDSASVYDIYLPKHAQVKILNKSFRNCNNVWSEKHYKTGYSVNLDSENNS